MKQIKNIPLGENRDIRIRTYADSVRFDVRAYSENAIMFLSSEEVRQLNDALSDVTRYWDERNNRGCEE